MEIRTRAVVFYEEGIRNAKEIGELYSISERTVRRWAQHHREDPENGLKPKKTGPKRSRRAIPVSLEQRIIRLKGKYPAWGARRIKHQFNLPCFWRTVHRILKKHGLLIRIKAKPQPAGKRFQRQHVDSMWQGDTFQIRAEAQIHGIKLIFGRPYHPRGPGKIERYHQTLYRELIALKEFRSLSHFRSELWNFDHLYNNWRKQEILDWMTPSSVYNNEINFNKNRKCLSSGQNLCQQNGH